MLQHSHLAPLDEQTIAQAELDAYIDALAQATAPEIEIDSDIDSHDAFIYLKRATRGGIFVGETSPTKCLRKMRRF